MSRFGLPSFKLLIVGAIAAIAFAHHKGALFDPVDANMKNSRPAASAPPRPAKSRKAAIPAGDVAKGKPGLTSSAPARGMEMPRPKPLLTGAVGGKAKPRPPAGIPVPASGPVKPKS